MIPKSGVPVFGMDHAQKYQAFWQCAQVPVISTTDSFGAKPVARAAALRVFATRTAGLSPNQPRRSEDSNATTQPTKTKTPPPPPPREGRIGRGGEKRIAAFDAVDETILHQEIER